MSAKNEKKVSDSGERSAPKDVDSTPKESVAKESPKAAPKEVPEAAPKEAPKAAPKEAPKAAPKEAPKAAPVPPAPKAAPVRSAPSWDKATWRAMAGVRLGTQPHVVSAALQAHPANAKFTEAEVRRLIKAVTEQRL